MARIRTFIAIELSAELRRRVAHVIQTLAGTTRSIRWVRAENTHLTLKFLGDVEETEIYGVCRATADAVKEAPAFRVECRGLGAFPSLDRPRTVWLGVDDPEQQMEQLHRAVDAALFELRFPREPRRFHPHVTIGRIRYGHRDLGDLIAQLQARSEWAGAPIDVGELIVFGSDLHRDGPVYTVLGRAPLEG